jgi:PAS domain S-box-containing protein
LQPSNCIARRSPAPAAFPISASTATRSLAFLGEGFEALTGFAPAEMDGPRFSSRLHKIESYGEFSELPHSERQRLARQGVLKEWRVDFQFERKDGVLIWLADHAVSVYDARAKSSARWAILMDITERKRAEEDHVRLQMQLAQAQRLESVGGWRAASPRFQQHAGGDSHAHGDGHAHERAVQPAAAPPPGDRQDGQALGRIDAPVVGLCAQADDCAQTA